MSYPVVSSITNLLYMPSMRFVTFSTETTSWLPSVSFDTNQKGFVKKSPSTACDRLMKLDIKAYVYKPITIRIRILTGQKKVTAKIILPPTNDNIL